MNKQEKKPKITIRYIQDNKTGERTIETNNPKCNYCGIIFKNNSYGKAYLADKDKILICINCLTNDTVSNIADSRNNSYLIGKIKIIKEVIINE